MFPAEVIPLQYQGAGLPRAAEVNAVRVITKNLLATGVDWLMNYLVVPVPEPVPAGPGGELRVRFGYRPGDEIPALTDGLAVAKLS